MINVNGKFLNIAEKRIKLEYTIRKIIEYSNQVVVLIYDDAIIENNVIVFDKEGNELWKINDVLNIKRPTGNVDIQRETEKILVVHSSLEMVFKIDIEKKQLSEKQFLR